MHRRSLLALAWVALASLALAPEMTAGAEEKQAPKIVIGKKLDAEQALLAEMTLQLLRLRGFDVEAAEPMGSAIVRKAQETGRVDIYWEDTATSLHIYNKLDEKLPPGKLYMKVAELDAKKGIVWLNPSAVSHTDAFAMRGADAKELGLSTLSDLAKVMNEGAGLKLATSVEFSMRPDGLKPVEREYDFRFARENIMAMDPGETYEALKNEKADVALVLSRDARIAEYGLFVLVDDKHVFPAHTLAPVVRQKTLERVPTLAPLLNQFSALLDNATMRRLGAQVETDKRPVEEVARAFLREHGLI
ncbi:MAG: glycine betaine ABC transporter substrate-binding protein [Kiloniellales bacterium]